MAVVLVSPTNYTGGVNHYRISYQKAISTLGAGCFQTTAQRETDELLYPSNRSRQIGSAFGRFFFKDTNEDQRCRREMLQSVYSQLYQTITDNSQRTA